MPNCAPAPEIVAKTLGLEKLIEHADLVITAEGRIDEQTLHGKIPFGVTRQTLIPFRRCGMPNVSCVRRSPRTFPETWP
jgi:hypothetical protein